MSQTRTLALFCFSFFSAVFLFVGKCNPVLASNYYVSPTGSNNNVGSSGSPWLTIQKAANNMTAGDTVFIHAGTYPERVSPPLSGTAANYITFRDFGDGEVVIDGGGGTRDESIHISNRSYLRFMNLHVGNNGYSSMNAGIAAYAGSHHLIFDNITSDFSRFGILLEGNNVSGETQSQIVSNVTIQNSTIKNNAAYGIFLYFKVTNTLIDHNLIYNENATNGVPNDDQYGIDLDTDYPGSPSNGPSRITITNNEVYGNRIQGIRPWNSSYILIKNNYTHHNGATGIQVEDGCQFVIVDGNRSDNNAQSYEYETGIWVDSTSHAVVQNNSMQGNQIGFHIGASNDVLARNNLIYLNNRAPSGSNVMGTVIDMGTTRVTFVHNTLWQNGVSGSRGLYVGATTADTVIKNNIFSESTGSYDGYINQVITSDYNNFYNTRTLNFYYNNQNNRTWAQYKTASGQDTNSLTSDPQFIDVGNTNFALGTSSPDINTGTTLTATTASGVGTSIPVVDARYFFDGYGLMTGDTIRVGNNTVGISAVDYVNNILTIGQSLSWNNGDGVSYVYNGAAPDIGALESGDTSPPLTPLTVTINQAVGQSDPTNAPTINFTVTFSDSVSDFATGDVSFSGTANATTATVTGSGTTYNIAVSGMSSSGTVIASINSGVAHDSYNTANSPSTSTDNTVTFNVPVPTLTSITIGDTAGYTNNPTPPISIVSSGSPTKIAFSCNTGANWSSWINYADTVSTFNITTGAIGCSTDDGNKTIYAKVKNSYGAESGYATDSTYYDTTGLTGSITNTSGGNTITKFPILNLTISNTGVGVSGAQMRFSCNNSDWSSWESYSTPKTNFNIKPSVVTYGCDTVDGARTVYVQYRDYLLNVSPSLSTGSFTLNTSMPIGPPNSPTVLTQYRSDSTTSLATGTFTNESTVVLKFNMSSGYFPDALNPEVEVQAIGTSFTDSVTNSGPVTIFSNVQVTGAVTITGLSPATSYHWQARISDSNGSSSWVQNGGNPDFGVDILPPSGGTINYLNSYQTSLAVGITINDGTDDFSGINASSRIVQRSAATLTSGICGTFSSFSTITPSGSYPIFVDSGVSSGNCYQYKYLVSDNAGNSTAYVSSNVIKVDATSPATPGTPSTTSPASNTEPTWAWTASTDNESGLGSYTVQWSQDDSFNTGVQTTSVDTNHFTQASPLSDGTWYFRVKAVDIANNSSSFSTPGAVEISAPTFSLTNISATPSDNGANISWSTGRTANSQVDYGLTDTYGYTTTVSDSVTPVTQHLQTISSLLSCSTYHYRVRSTDATANQVASNDYSFTTSGCPGSAVVSSQSSQLILTSTGGMLSLEQNSLGISVSLPANFTNNDVELQIKKIEKNAALSEISAPSNYSLISDNLFDLKALVDVPTLITTFDRPLNVRIKYDPSTLSGFPESRLAIFRYDGSSWQPLQNCQVDSTSKTVTCLTSHFSIFGLFGQPEPSSSPSSGSSSSSTGASATGCNLSPAYGTPDLFEIRTTSTTATIKFTPIAGDFTSVYIAYSRKPNLWEYGTEYQQNNTRGVLSYTIRNLKPNTKYYFQLRVGNGCATGNWSNVLSAKTTSSSKLSSTFYKNIYATVTAKTRTIIKPQPTPKLRAPKTSPSPIPQDIFISRPKTPTAKTSPTPAPVIKDSLTRSAPKKSCFLWWCN
jgi:parallel beta-helix repeat protein